MEALKSPSIHNATLDGWVHDYRPHSPHVVNFVYAVIRYICRQTFPVSSAAKTISLKKLISLTTLWFRIPNPTGALEWEDLRICNFWRHHSFQFWCCISTLSQLVIEISPCLYQLKERWSIRYLRVAVTAIYIRASSSRFIFGRKRK